MLWYVFTQMPTGDCRRLGAVEADTQPEAAGLAQRVFRWMEFGRGLIVSDQPELPPVPPVEEPRCE